MKITEENLRSVGKVGLRLGKAVVIEGIKAVTLKATAKAITTGFEDGVGAIKDLSLDDVLGDEKPKERLTIFKRKDKTKVDIIEPEVTSE